MFKDPDRNILAGYYYGTEKSWGIMVKNPCFEIVDIADEHVAVPVGEEAKSFHGVVALSGAAAFLLKKLETPKSQEELLTLLTQEYDVAPELAKEDIGKLIRTLSEMGIILE